MSKQPDTRPSKTTDTVKTATEKQSSRGGKRAGSGRPSGSGKYGEPTKAIRVPEGSVSLIKSYLATHYKNGENDNSISQPSSNSNSPQTSSTEKVVNIKPAEDFDSNVVPLGQAVDTSILEDVNTIPLFSNKVAAGYPAYADDHLDTAIDINDYLVETPSSTFMLKVEGESMKNAGILPDDVLIVDRSKKAKHNKIVIAALDGELTVKRLYQRGGRVKLIPENEDYPDIEVTEQSTLVIWGVVIGSFRRFETTFF